MFEALGRNGTNDHPRLIAIRCGKACGNRNFLEHNASRQPITRPVHSLIQWAESSAQRIFVIDLSYASTSQCSSTTAKPIGGKFSVNW
jgi:hypothetical protein